MTRPRLYSTEALVLRAAPLGEADRLLTLLTPALGKLQVKARGVRKTASKLAGHLEPLTRSLLHLARGQTWDTITGAEARESFLALKSDLALLFRALYVAEVADLLSPLEEPAPPVYALLLEGMRALMAPGDLDLLLRYLEVHLLLCAGFLPEFQQCTECREEVAPGRHLFSPQRGGVVCTSCGSPAHGDQPISINALKVLRFLSTATFGSLRALRVPSALHRELAQVLESFLRHVLEREVRSAAFLRLAVLGPSSLAPASAREA
ncbi:MAG: DNA repair protein RecO [Chloroflexi bacterium]|nr:DNA repair protein RecO [Chloroflexota bacterium]